ALATSGAAIRLAVIIMIAGPDNTWSVATLPIVVPKDEMNVIAKLVTIVIRAGIFRITSINDMRIYQQTSRTIHEEMHYIKASIEASGPLNFNSSPDEKGTSFLGIIIMTAASVARTAYTKST